ncbi:MAG: acetylglutamate kinase [Nitrospinae bacterium]|nr:acetylglutamate kinase [Nitrospinota bacterium]
MEQSIKKAGVLLESLPYLRDFAGKTIVIKYGGAAMVQEELKAGFARDVTLLKYIGINPVVVHGGGPQINKTLERMGVKSKFIEGYRVSEGETLDVVEMVLVGKVNKEIVSLISTAGGKAVGLSGKDGGLLTAEKMLVTKQTEDVNRPEIIDVGMVGKVTSVNPAVLLSLDKDGFIPVIAPVGAGINGETYNINADTVAGEISAALGAEKLVLLTDTQGIWGADKQMIPSLDEKTIKQMISSGVISGGMLPKVAACLRALAGGVHKTHIIDGRVEHAVLLEIFTDAGVGTQIV